VHDGTEPTPEVPNPGAARWRPKGAVLLGLLRTTDPKQIGILYLVTSFGFFVVVNAGSSPRSSGSSPQAR
jgi:hypothetical protein